MKKRRRVRRPFLEHLEDRCQPSTSIADFNQINVDAKNFVPDRLIVRFREGVKVGELGPRIEALGNDAYLIHWGDWETMPEAIASFRARNDIAYAEPDYRVHLDQVPNDPQYSEQWAHNNTGQNGGIPGIDIHAQQAWDITTGSGNTVVAMIDTGIDYNHPDLAANIWTNPGEIPGNGIDYDYDGYIDDVRGWNFVGNNNNPKDDNGHGTHTAGIVGAVGNNGQGVAGVNWHVQLMPLKFLDAGSGGSLSDAIRALNFAVDHGVKVSNNSWGGGDYSQAMYDALVNARNAGHIFVVAAGNSGFSNDIIPTYPSSYDLPNVISVAALDSSDQLAPFSSYGATSVDLGAPGVEVLSTLPNNSYGEFSGTSMSTAFVTGAVALLRDLHPDWTGYQVVYRLLTSVEPIASLQGFAYSGGRLDLKRMISDPTVPPSVPPPPPPPPPPPSPDVSGPWITDAAFLGPNANSIDHVRLTFDEAVDPRTIDPYDVWFDSPSVNISFITLTNSAVPGSDNMQFDVFFPLQTAQGQYRFQIGPDLTDFQGQMMNQDKDLINGEWTDDVFLKDCTLTVPTEFTFRSTNIPLKIRDLQTASSTLLVNGGVPLNIRDLNVNVWLEHGQLSDLDIALQSPWGTRVDLFNRRGGSSNKLTDTTFDDEAATSIADGSPPFYGSFRPEQSLTAVDNHSAAGTWTLLVSDLAASNIGTLVSWSITIKSV